MYCGAAMIVLRLLFLSHLHFRVFQNPHSNRKPTSRGQISHSMGLSVASCSITTYMAPTARFPPPLPALIGKSLQISAAHASFKSRPPMETPRFLPLKGSKTLSSFTPSASPSSAHLHRKDQTLAPPLTDSPHGSGIAK